MSRIVLDASVTAGWLLSDELDPRTASVLAILRQDGAIVPQLWHYEIRNALLVAERREPMPEGGATERPDSLKGLPILTDQETDLRVAFDLAREHGLSFSDALYLELAKRRNGPLATLDERLTRAALAEGIEVPLT